MTRRPAASAAAPLEDEAAFARLETEGPPATDAAENEADAYRPDAGETPAAAADADLTWLTTDISDLGPAGTFVEMTVAEAQTHRDGLLITPTADQLALRPR